MKWQKALELIIINYGDSILDAACGSDELYNIIAEQQKNTITGEDFSSATIDFCKQQYTHANLQFITHDLQKEYFAGSSFSNLAMLEP